MKADIKAVRGILRDMGLMQKPPPGRVMESRKRSEAIRRVTGRQIMHDENNHG
jgi:hypothetical protein